MSNIENLRKPWKKGESGNPNGRPKGVKNIKTYIREALEKEVRLTDITDKKMKTLVRQIKEKSGGNLSRAELMYFMLTMKASMGDLGAIHTIFDRLEGRPVQFNMNEDTQISYEDFLERLVECGE